MSMVTRLSRTLLVIGFVAALVVVAGAAPKLVAGHVCSGGGSGSSATMELVGSIPSSAAGISSGGGYRLTGAFVGAVQVWREEASCPDGVAAAASGMVSGLSAVGTEGGGAQITFSLSAPANVEIRVLNIAGRPVRTVTAGNDCEAGLNTIVWSGLSDYGLRAPNGLYIVQVRARSDAGEQSRSITSLRLQR